MAGFGEGKEEVAVRPRRAPLLRLRVNGLEGQSSPECLSFVVFRSSEIACRLLQCGCVGSGRGGCKGLGDKPVPVQVSPPHSLPFKALWV